MTKNFFASIFLVISLLGFVTYGRDLHTDDLMDNDIKTIIYTKEGCWYCIEAKKLLQENNIIFNNIDLTSNKELHQKLAIKTGQSTVPYIFLNGKFIGGYQDLLELINTNKLESFLNSIN